MMEEWNNPAFDAPGAPQKWLVMLWGLAIVVAIGTEYIRYDMSKKEISNGKGDKNRITNKKKFDMNWEKIFGIDKEVHDHPLGAGFAQKDIKKGKTDEEKKESKITDR